MSDWQVIFLGIMAAALVAMATMQIVISLTLVRTARQMSEVVQSIQRDLRPLIDKASRMTDDAARAASLAVTQMERIDGLVSLLSSRISETVTVVQEAVVSPLKQGATVIAAVRGLVAAFREFQRRNPGAREDEDPLFVG